MMRISPPSLSDWAQFYALTADEGWRIPQLERQLFLGPWSHCARVLEVDRGFAGLVTAVAHEKTGWVGNLIVPPHLRGRGYGVRLFKAAHDDLVDRGMTSLWLTASKQGRPIYEKSGFAAVDKVERWIFSLRNTPYFSGELSSGGEDMLRAFDRMVWGESRHSMLDYLFPSGQVFACDDAAAILQQGADIQIIGPWYSQKSGQHANQQLLLEMLSSADPTIDIVVDMLASSPLHNILNNAGFRCIGESALMVKGDCRTVDLRTMASLASLGSFG